MTHSARGLLFVSAIDLGVFLFIYFVAVRISRATTGQLFLRWSPGWWVVPLGAIYSVAVRLVTFVIALVIIFFVLTTRIASPQQVSELAQQNQPNFDVLVDTQAMHANAAYYWLTITLVSFLNAG